jgi:flagellar protein FliJ
MKRRFRLASVLRARRAQEDAARGAVVRAHADVHEAAEHQAQSEHALAERDSLAVTHREALAFVAAQAARQALAAEISAAGRATAAAETAVDDRMGELTDAAVRRRAVEKLAERHAEAVRKDDASTSQKLLDDLAGARHGTQPGGDR